MKKISYKIQVIAFVVLILLVLVNFKVMPNKQLAGLLAGIGFLILPLLFLIGELKGEKNTLHRTSLILFLVGTAIPIFLVRITTWGEDFSTTYFFGVPSIVLHRLANFLYLGMLASAIYHWRRSAVAEAAIKK